MTSAFEPELSVLQAGQKRLWLQFRELPDWLVLCGGTAIALQLGHRTSVDFDFFGDRSFDPDELLASIRFLQDARIQQKSFDTLTCLVEQGEGEHGESVQVSFFGVPQLKLIARPRLSADNQVKVASLLDLAGMKCAVIQKRAELKDYLDLDAILCQGNIDLATALAVGSRLYGVNFNPEISLKALTYFEDGNISQLPPEARARLIAAVQSVDPLNLPDID